MQEILSPIIPSTLEQDIEKYGQIIDFTKGDILFSPDELLKRFFVVLQGRIKVSQTSLQSGREQTLQILAQGSMYDVVTLLDGERHENLLTALDDVQTLSLPMDVVHSWMKSNSSFNRLLFPYIAKQIREIEELVTDLSFYNTSERLLKLIIKNIDPGNPGRLKLIHDLPHEEIASLIGTVRKVLNRHIQELKKEGLIDVERKNIRLKDSYKLLGELDKFD
jgi:CRP-like cAMP-binding protein